MLMVIVNETGIPLNVEVESAATDEGHVAEKTMNGIEVRKHDYVTGRRIHHTRRTADGGHLH